MADLIRIWPEFAALAPAIAEQLEIDAKYAVYLERQSADVAAFRRDESLLLPADLDYMAIPGLSNEVRQRLATVRPSTVGQAGRVEGVTPAALALLVVHLRRPAAARRPWLSPGAGKAVFGESGQRPARLDLTADRARALSLTPVSRETAERLDRFVALMLQWQR